MRLFSSFALACVLLSNSGMAQAGFVLTANAAGSQTSTVANITTETFDSFKAGRYQTLNTAIGTLTSPNMQIVSNDQYGGAGGQGNYFSIGAQSGATSATLMLNGAQAYFGFWWSAADNENKITFLSHGSVVASFDSSTASGALGSSYLGNPNGNPNSPPDAGEKFAYLNFIATDGSTFDEVDFSNLNTGTGFESDNWSVSSTALTPTYPGTPIGGVTPSAVPEPSSLAMTAVGLSALVGLISARRKRGRN
jgi:hypothetical protein